MYAFGILFSIILCVLLFLLLKSKKDYGHYWKKNCVKFEKPLFLIGNVIEVISQRKSVGVVVRDLYFKFINERFFGFWILTTPNFVIRCPDLIKEMLVRDFDYFCDRNVTCNENVDFLSANMMFFMRNPKWKFIRSKTTPMFSSAKVKYIYPKIQSIANEMVTFLSSNSGTCDVEEICLKYSTEVICSTAFGIDAYSFQDKDTPLTLLGKDVFGRSLRNTFISANYYSNSPLVDILKIKLLRSQTATFLSDTFLNMLKQRELKDSDRKDLLNVMLEFKNEYKFSNDELVAQAGQFFLAAYETTSVVVSFLLYELSVNKDIEDRLRAEINENEDEKGDISYSSLTNMTYLDKVVSEILRKYPPVPFLGRICAKDYKIPATDIIIDKGIPIVIPVLGLHFDPEYFPDPEVFDPERFSEENVRTRHPYSYLPFGDGQRNCIGKRMALISVKLAVSYIVKNFDLEIDRRTKLPLKFDPRTFTLHTNSIFVKFVKLAEATE